ncbi:MULTISPECIES: hypothetical protein [Burkholderiaceae]|nr:MULTISPECIES: hypothetical protein [Burkholderiaceae]KWU19220.1 hypothetical protein AS149_13325 [Burkholderia cenocepacia]
MPKNTLFDTTFSMLAIGGLSRNAEFKSSCQMAKQFPGNLPVLNATVDPSEFNTFMQAHQNGNAPSCFGFGNIASLSRAGDKMQIMTIRFQVGGVQFYWLADMSDGDVWRAVDAWRKRGQVPIAIGHSDQMAYVVIDYAAGSMTLDRFRDQIRSEPSQEFFDMVSDVASSGFVEAQATTDIPDTPLDRVIVNLLVSPRQQQYVHGNVMRDKPVMADGGMSVH